MGEQISDTAIGTPRQVFEMSANASAQTGDLLRQNDAEFGHQAAQAVVDRGAFFDEAIAGAVQAQDDLLVFFLDRDEAHVGPAHGFADRLGIGRVILAALARQAVGRDEFGGHQPTAAPSGVRRSRLPCR